MPFEVGRLLLLMAWFFAGIYLTQRYGTSQIIPRDAKHLSWIVLLLVGPPYFLILVTLFVIHTTRSGDVTTTDAIWMALGEKPLRGSGWAVDANTSSMVLLDASGRSLSEVYGGSRGDAEVLTLTAEIIAQAVGDLASDILIQPTSSTQFSVRFRVDGHLRTVHELNAAESGAVINSIKAISGMDIAERRRPQDGAFVAQTPQGNISFRVATAGVLRGEKISIRVLDQSASTYSLRDIGLTKKNYNTILRQVNKPSGMILVCGPTGSGKSTTLHAMLREVNFDERNVVTIEDPIEYVLPEASQIEVNTKAGITFSKTLRSVLRQDPDVISIGEIRDVETAEIALQASQTGHLVFATLHASSNMTALLRLIDLGIRPFLIAAALNIVVSQRLVRKLCKHCKLPAQLSDRQIKSMVKRKIDPSQVKRAKGCPRCKGTGYRGRIGVFDVLHMTDELRERLSTGELTVKSTGEEEDKQTQSLLHRNATRLVLSGLTTKEEVAKLVTSTE